VKNDDYRVYQVSTVVMDLVAVFALFVLLFSLLCFCAPPFSSVNKDLYKRNVLSCRRDVSGDGEAPLVVGGRSLHAVVSAAAGTTRYFSGVCQPQSRSIFREQALTLSRGQVRAMLEGECPVTPTGDWRVGCGGGRSHSRPAAESIKSRAVCRRVSAVALYTAQPVDSWKC